MYLPGEPFIATDSGDLTIFLQDICEPCDHVDHCSILAHAGMYGGASEWRQIGSKTACTRQEVA